MNGPLSRNNAALVAAIKAHPHYMACLEFWQNAALSSGGLSRDVHCVEEHIQITPHILHSKTFRVKPGGTIPGVSVQNSADLFREIGFPIEWGEQSVDFVRDLLYDEMPEKFERFRREIARGWIESALATASRVLATEDIDTLLREYIVRAVTDS